MQHSQYLDTSSEATTTWANRRFYQIGKRALDLVLATVALIVLSPVCLVIALLIKLDSPGPVFFKQIRLGLGGKPFTFYKFRTMYDNSDPSIHHQYVQSLIRNQLPETHANDSGGASYKLSRDPRITRVGHVLRKASLDEIPQLFNVIKGDMSLVGPRPPLPYEVEVYMDWHKRRLDALPGITGLWQVRGRSRVSFDEMVHMDLEYMMKCSFWLDIKILYLTIPAVISGSGAK